MKPEASKKKEGGMMLGGGVWPVVQRELRAAARWPFGRWLRVGGALGGVIMFCVVTADVPEAVVGTELFSSIHLLLLYLICGLVPALAADCIACERREGTLGLLFMTPLTASGIVLGKIVAQVLRGLTLWMAVLPLLTIPFLYGGVTWGDVGVFLTIELCAGMLCLAAGILASCLTDHRAIVFILAYLFMGAFVTGMGHYQDWRMAGSPRVWMTPIITSGRIIVPRTAAGMRSAGVIHQVLLTSGSSAFFVSAPRFRVRGLPAGLGARFMPGKVLAEDFIIASLALLVALRFAGWCVERSWQDKVPSAQSRILVRRYCAPLFARGFALRMRRALERNPIAWLQQYSWKARVSKWGLCLLFVILECAVIDANDPYALGWVIAALLLVLAAAYTFAGVNGFLQERKTGALELILVSPISVNEIIFGRVWGLWKQFLPSALLLAGSDIAVHVMIPQSYFHYPGRWGWEAIGNWFWLKEFEMAAIYLTLPIFATVCALRFKNLFLASALTWAALLLPPVAGLILLLPLRIPESAWLALLGGNIFSAGLAIWLLREGLTRRSYSY
jgi:ABC-type Na+ efflux pump permease subunit